MNELAFAKWLEENTIVIREDKITLYRYHDSEGWGNYILDDIFMVYKEREPISAHERLETLIDNAKTKEELELYYPEIIKFNVAHLGHAYGKKLKELST